MYASAHTHTEYSDGKQSHLEILADAQSLSINNVVFADHDLLIPDEVHLFLQSYNGPVRWHSGIELTTHFSPQASTKAGTLHVLGIGVDYTNPALRDYCELLQADRVRTMHGTIVHLQAIGFDIDQQIVLRKVGKGAAVSPHFVQALELDTNEHNRAIHQNLLNELKVKAMRGNKKAKKLYELWQQDGPKQEPYLLYMKNYSFRPASASNRSHQKDIVESCKLIRRAGGKAILAHWFFNKDSLPKEQLEALVSQGTFDGLETHVINTISSRNVDEDVDVLEKLAKTYKLPTISSADSHSFEDMQAYIDSPYAKGSAQALAVFLRE